MFLPLDLCFVHMNGSKGWAFFYLIYPQINEFPKFYHMDWLTGSAANENSSKIEIHSGSVSTFSAHPSEYSGDPDQSRTTLLWSSTWNCQMPQAARHCLFPVSSFVLEIHRRQYHVWPVWYSSPRGSWVDEKHLLCWKAHGGNFGELASCPFILAKKK